MDTGAARKQVTAVFADLAGSTAFGEQLDPEAAREALAPYYELLRSTIEDHAGTVAKFMGDGMMALFGVPEVAEDDALRAVSAGIELQARFRAFADHIRERHGAELGLRVGINSGELVVADGDADLVGDVLNTAARLESSCAPGRVLVGEDTWRLTRSGVAYEVMGEVRVKGKAEPVAAFQVAETEAPAIEANIPFVGRAREMDELLATFAVTRDSPTASLVTIVGSPGVGKTRLAYELRAATDARSFDLRFERRGSTTFSPIAELLREVTDGSAEGIDRLLADHPEHDRLVPVVQSFVGIGDARSTEESFWAVRRLLEHLTVLHGPVIVVVDDIQWAEPLFWDLLDHLVEWAEAPVLLVALARPELRELRPELTQSGRRVAVSIALEGLDSDATRELAVRLLDTDRLPDELVERIPDTTEGNPLFVRELVQMLVDDGTLARDGDRWRLTIDADAIEVPPTILSLLASRVERLPDDERQVIELGSVIGTEFDRGSLTAIASPDIGSRLGALIDRLRRKDLIEPSGAWAGDHPVYRFHHVLVRDAAYRRLLKGRRADLHELVGRHLAETAGVGDDADVTVAHHFEQAFGFRSELGQVDENTAALAAAAVERLHRAADAALAREDLPSAGGYAQRALTLVAEASAERDELLVVGCEALLASGDVGAATPLVRELHERSTDERLAAWADCFRAERWSLTDPDRLTEAAEAADAAATRLAELDDQAGVAKARFVRAGCLARLGRVGECEGELDLALGAARAAGDRRRTVAVLGAAPLAALWGPSPVARAGGRCLDVLRLLRITTAAPAVEATSVRCQGVLEALRGRFDSARDKLEQSRTTSRDLGLRQGLFETELFAGFVEMWAGDPVAAEPHLREAHEGLGRLGIGADAGQAGALLARSLLVQGRVDEADALAKEAVDTAGQNLQTAMSSRAVLAEIRAAQGDHSGAAALIAEALEIAERTDVVLDHALVLLAAERVAAATGDAPARRRHAQAARRLLADKGAADALAELVEAEPGTDRAATGERPQAAPPGTAGLATNPALEVALEGFLAQKELDAERAIAIRHEDFVCRQHSSLTQTMMAHTRSGRDDYVRYNVRSMRENGPEKIRLEVVAVRDSASLLRTISEIYGEVVTFHHVVEVDGGLIVAEDWYGSDQLLDAVARLELVAADTPAKRAAALGGARLRGALASGDLATVRTCLTDEFAALDHRQLGTGVRDADAWLASLEPPADGERWTSVPTATLRRGEAGGEHVELTTTLITVGDASYDTLSIKVYSGELLHRVEHFDPAEVDAALTRFDEITGSGQDRLRNLATTTLVDRAGLLTGTGDWEGLGRLVHDEMVFDMQRRVVGAQGGGKQEWLDAARSWSGLGLVPGRVPIAVRGDRLALIEVDVAGEADADHLVFHAVVEVDEAGLITYLGAWNEDDIAEAQMALDRRWADQLGLAEGHPARLLNAAVYATDESAVVAAAHPDIELREHRRISFEGGDQAQLARNASSMDVFDHIVVPVVHRISDDAVLFEKHAVGSDGDVSPYLVVVGFRDGLAGSYDIYDVDDLGAAIARFEALGGTTAPHPSQLRNQATITWIERIPPLLTEGAIEASGRWLRDDMVFDVHRRVVAAPPGGKAELLETATSWRDIGMQPTRVTIAVRGERLALFEMTFTQETGDERVPVFMLVEVDDDGLVTHADTWDDVDLAAAQIALDARWFDAIGLDADHPMRTVGRAAYSTDPGEVLATAHPELEYRQHRTLSFAGGDRDEFERRVSVMPMVDHCIVPHIHRLSDGAVLFEKHEVAADGERSEFLVTAGFRDRLVGSYDIYDVDDLDAAVARYDELAGGSTRERPALANLATRIFDDDHVRAVKDGDAEHTDGLIDDRAVYVTHRGIAGGGGGGKRELIDAVMSWQHLSMAPVYDVLAVRGEHLALVRATFSDGREPDRIVFLGVVEVGDDGRLTYWSSWPVDDLTAAQIALDHRWYDRLGFGDDHPLRRFSARAYDPAPDAWNGTLHPDLEWVEHRSLSFPGGGADDLLATVSTMDLVDRIEIPIHHRISDTGALIERVEVATDGSTTRMLVLAVLANGLARRIEVFEIDELDAAVARFDELSRGRAGGLANRATRTWFRVPGPDEPGSLEGIERWVRDDLVFDVHRRVVAAPGGGKRELLATAESWGQSGMGLARSVVAIRGDQLALIEMRFGSGPADGDDDHVVVYALTEVDDDGMICHLGVWDDVDLTAAQMALDERWFDQLGLPDDHPSRRYDALAYTTDPQDLIDVAPSDIRYVEHRTISFESGGAVAFAAASSAMELIDHVVVPVIHRVSAGAVAYEVDAYAADGECTSSIIVVGYREGEVRTAEIFDVDHLDAAIARFDELTAEADSVALSLMQRLADAVRASDREGARALMAGGFTGYDHTRLNVGHELDTDAFVESQIEQWHRADEAGIEFEVLAESGHLALVRADFTMDGAVMPMRVVTEVAHDRFTRFDIYDAEQEADARAEFDRRVAAAATEVGNAAWAVAKEVYEALTAGDTDRFAELVADDYSAIPATPLRVKDDGRLSRDDVLAIVPERLFPLGEGRLIATRGEQLALGVFTPDDPGSFPPVFTVTRLDDDGRLVESLRFGPDDREAADEALDELWGRHGGPTDVLDARQRLKQAWRERSRSTVRALFHDDFTSVDHRELAFGERDADEFVASLDIESGYGVDAGWHVGVQPIRHTDSVLLEHWTMTSNDDTFVWEVYQVLRVRDGKFVTWDNFPIDQLAEAERRFDELAREPGHQRPIERVYAAFGTLWNARDLDGLRGLHHGDLEIFSHRRVVTPGNTRGDEAWRSLRAMAEVFPTFEHTTIHTPTDQVSLARIAVTNEDEIELAMLGIIAIDDEGLINRIATFDPDDLDRARSLLAEWAGEGTGPTVPPLDNAALRFTRTVTARLGSGERFDIDEVVEQGFTFAGRRRSTPQIDGDAKVLAETFEYWRTVGLERVGLTALATRGDSLALARNTVVTSGGDEMSVLFLGELGSTGRWQHLSAYDTDQLAEAIDELDQRWLALGGPTNLIEGSGRMRRAFAVPGLDAELVPLTSDFFTVDHRLVGLGRRDRDAFIASGDDITPSIAYMTQSFGWVERGDTSIASYEIMIERHDDGFVWHALHVARYEGIEMAELHVFAPEQFAEAQARFGEMVSELQAAEAVDPDHPVLRRGLEVVDAWNRDDLDAVRALAHPDLEIFSYRSVVTPGHTRGPEAHEALLAVHEFFPRMTSEPIASRRDDLGLSAVTYVSPDEIELKMLVVTQMDSGRLLRRSATFDADDIDGALALLEDWASEGASEHGVARQLDGRLDLTNDMVLLVERLAAEWPANPTIDAGDYLEPDYEFVQARASTQPVHGGAELLATTLDFWVDAGAVELRVETCAVRGRHLALGITAIVTDAGDEMPFLSLGELGESGRWRRMTIFDLDQLGEALDALDERWKATGGPAELIDFDLAWRRIFRGGTAAELDAIVAPEFVSVDHRPIGLGTRSRDDFLSTMAGFVGDADIVLSRVLLHDAEHALSAVRFTTRSDGSDLVDGLALTRLVGGRLALMEHFAFDQIDEARAVFAERVGGAATGVPTGPPTNSAVRRLEQLAADRSASGGVDLAERVEPDFEVHSRRSSAMGEQGGAETLQATFGYWREVGAVETRFDAIAVRDDVLALTRNTIVTATGDELVVLTITELGPTGRIRRLVSFEVEQLDEALDGLDERWVELGGSADWVELSRVGRQAMADGDPSLLLPLLTDDFVSVDRRPLGLPDRGRAEFAETVAHMGGQGTRGIATEVIAHRDGCVLVRLSVSAPDGSNWDLLDLWQFRDGLLTRADVFDPADIDTALRMFDELVDE